MVNLGVEIPTDFDQESHIAPSKSVGSATVSSSPSVLVPKSRVEEGTLGGATLLTDISRVPDGTNPCAELMTLNGSVNAASREDVTDICMLVRLVRQGAIVAIILVQVALAFCRKVKVNTAKLN